MYSAHTLSGTESSSFWSYWEVVKNQWYTLTTLGPKIEALWQQAKTLKSYEQDPQRRKELDNTIYDLSVMYLDWQETNGYLQSWWEKWTTIANYGWSQEEPNLGLSLTLPGWAQAWLAGGGIAALIFVATRGMKLPGLYNEAEMWIAAYKRGDVSQDQFETQMERMHEEEMKPGYLETFAKGMGEGLGQYTPIVIGVGALLFFGPTLLARYAR